MSIVGLAHLKLHMIAIELQSSTIGEEFSVKLQKLYIFFRRMCHKHNCMAIQTFTIFEEEKKAHQLLSKAREIQ